MGVLKLYGRTKTSELEPTVEPEIETRPAPTHPADRVTFDQWIGGRKIAHHSTNSGAEPLAFQTWRNFKEAFAPELIGRAYEETSDALNRPVQTCIDPFGGSGTTALACQFLGVAPFTIEVNPYLADLIQAKLGTYSMESLISDFERVSDRRGRKQKSGPFKNAPQTFVEPGVKGRFVFYLPVANRLAEIRRRIDRIEDSGNRRLLRVLLASIAVDCSNVVVSGKGRRYRKGWEYQEVPSAQVDELFSEAFLRAVYEIKRFQNRLTLAAEVRASDARVAIPTRRRFDMAVFSPPYPNSFDYTDVYNVELWVCGYLQTAEANRKLRNSTLRSHVQIKRPFDTRKLVSSTLSSVYADLATVREKLWNKDIPEMVCAYFGDMHTILSRISCCLRDNAHCYIVVGDSRYSSVHIPVGKILRELSTMVSLEIIGTQPFRSMRGSPQQGGRAELEETLLIFRRVPRS